LRRDAGDVDLHIRAVARRLERRERVDRDQAEQRRAQADQDVRAQARRLSIDLALDADRAAQAHGQEDAQHHHAVVELEQLPLH
jgi:hypothetical protein